MTSLEPVSTPDPAPASSPQPQKKTVADLISGLPGTLTALLVALTAAIGAYTKLDEQRSLSKSSYEALKQGVDRNTEAIEQLVRERAREREWMRAIAAAVRELQLKEPSPARAGVPSAPPSSPLDEPDVPPKPLPSFDQLKK
jgi:uncharacterized protein HemX